ncbi:BZ3500_MvSof-1268-A1-R1_Chr5-2g07863 [Microbotryum saponariae]|uniref:BZ3500_MvSof-1268-A1-R1_Chr5-2g07863 protein n=1 Tax=Microbotryum saponariae TaxID=289078 RepID=A0A2X0NDU8_9BASI|nr:BZ3500_MvSof-1268-A1-R1_Chr5-2g07863 [Microbotryum saponariae]SDA05732.1 BZ3501_MvSof-1269-A2-R1_Chr5-2g07685 [Microbotryum saponariae]
MSDSADDNFEVELLRPAIEMILKGSDRASVTAKGVRKQLQDLYPKMDIKAHKTAIDSVTFAIFNDQNDDSEEADSDEHEGNEYGDDIPVHAPVKQGVKHENGSNGRHAIPYTSPAQPIKAERKPTAPRASNQLTDEQIAMRLQNELNARPSRAGTSTASGSAKSKANSWSAGTKKRKSKSAATIGSDEDDSAPKKQRKVSNTGFNKLHRLSQEMADVCGSDQLSRPQVTKALWVYIKGNDLQLPEKKTEIRLDEKLRVSNPDRCCVSANQIADRSSPVPCTENIPRIDSQLFHNGQIHREAPLPPRPGGRQSRSQTRMTASLPTQLPVAGHISSHFTGF